MRVYEIVIGVSSDAREYHAGWDRIWGLGPPFILWDRGLPLVDQVGIRPEKANLVSGHIVCCVGAAPPRTTHPATVYGVPGVVSVGDPYARDRGADGHIVVLGNTTGQYRLDQT